MDTFSCSYSTAVELLSHFILMYKLSFVYTVLWVKIYGLLGAIVEEGCTELLGSLSNIG